MEGERGQELWLQFEEEMRKHLNTPKVNNEILQILNEDKGKRFPIKIDSLPKE
jgi:hypothetical protein